MNVVNSERNEFAWKDLIWLANGYEARFPLCCIMFFMDVFDKNFRDFVSKNGDRDNGEKIWYEFGDGYIRCPDCIAKDVGLGSWDLNEDIFLQPFLGANQESIPLGIYEVGVNE